MAIETAKDIQRAMDEANSKSKQDGVVTIHIPPWEYLVEAPISISSQGILLQGAGRTEYEIV